MGDPVPSKRQPRAFPNVREALTTLRENLATLQPSETEQAAAREKIAAESEKAVNQLIAAFVSDAIVPVVAVAVAACNRMPDFIEVRGQIRGSYTLAIDLVFEGELEPLNEHSDAKTVLQTLLTACADLQAIFTASEQCEGKDACRHRLRDNDECWVRRKNRERVLHAKLMLYEILREATGCYGAGYFQVKVGLVTRDPKSAESPAGFNERMRDFGQDHWFTLSFSTKIPS